MSDLNAGTGVNYPILDRAKRYGQLIAEGTDVDFNRFDMRPAKASRGKSAFVMTIGDRFMAHVEEELGSKWLVAEAMHSYGFPNAYFGIGYDGAAAILNDVITSGALPVSCLMHLAVSSADWFSDEEKYSNLMIGWAQACMDAGCVYGGGEMPELPDSLQKGAIQLSGSAVGFTPSNKMHYYRRLLYSGDAVIFAESSGIQVNALTKARRIADGLEDGFRTLVPGADGSYGRELLVSSHIYVPLVEWCQRNDMRVSAALHISGHGWRKLMRSAQEISYVIHTLPRRNPLFGFIQDQSGLSDRQMYAAFNMGAGFALIMPEADADRLLAHAETAGWPFRVFKAGVMRRGPRQVVIGPLNITLPGSSYPL